MTNTNDDATKALETQFKMLDLKYSESKRVLERRKKPELEKLFEEMQKRVDKINEMKNQIQESMIESDKSMEEVTSWTQNLETRIETYDQPMETLQAVLKDIENEIEQAKEIELLKAEEIKKQKRYEEEKEIEIMRLKLKKDFEKESSMKDEKETTKSQVKLPKLIITKFEGTHLDWQRFWSQFETEIDRSSIPQVSKFNYLKEMLKPKARTLVDSLPFTTEGYERAKNILKSKYGKESEVTNAHIQALLSLPVVHSSNAIKINQFYEKLVAHVQALDTMGKLKEVKGYVRLTLDKLTGIKADLVRTDENWQEWEFDDLTKELSKWIDRNYISTETRPPEQRKEQLLHTQTKPNGCVYCNDEKHKSRDCEKVISVSDRRKILSEKRLCFNCTGSSHQAQNCKSKRGCQVCHRRHHTSICESPESMKLAAEDAVIHPVVLVKVNNIICRALLDTGAGSSYASEALLNRIKAKPSHSEFKRIEMMMSTTNKKLSVYNLEISDLSDSFTLQTRAFKVEKNTLLSLPNPNYEHVINRYSHLKDVTMNEDDKKPELPIHLVLGASDYAKIKMQEVPRIGQQGEPIAEKTKFGWIIISPGNELLLNNLLLSRTTVDDFERLCSIDVLGIKDSENAYGQNDVHKKFIDQLEQNSEGWYETNLIWKEKNIELPCNKSGSLGRLNSLVSRLRQSPDLFQQYKAIMKEQLDQGVIETVSTDIPPSQPEFYLPHRAVVREHAETTKIRIVFDASARAHNSSNSLNDCLEVGPNLQNLIWEIMVRTRFYPVAICGDLKKAFWQIRVRENNRDALRFHWFRDEEMKKIQTYRFARVVFGLTQSPFILQATLQHHLQKYASRYPAIIEKIKKDIYVDDLVTGSESTDKAAELKEKSKQIFNEAGFKLHKWHSNKIELEDNIITTNHDLTYAKMSLGVKANETRILGTTWNKKTDQLSIHIPGKIEKVTKRNILQKLAAIYDILGIISPCTLTGKSIFRDVCEAKYEWDSEIPSTLQKKWRIWEDSLPPSFHIPRSIVGEYREISSTVEVHIFGDASIVGTSAVVYAVVRNTLSTTQGLVTSKSRLSKKNTTIPRLELNAAVMVANLGENISKALTSVNITGIYGWSDSAVVLHWLKGNGQYKQYVQNRVNLINSKNGIQWRYVNTSENAADIASRGCNAQQLNQRWFHGPKWLSDKSKWPKEIKISSSKESEIEAKQIKLITCLTTEIKDEIDKLLEKFEFWKVVRVVGWIKRFHRNSLIGNNKATGPLSTDELCEAVTVIIKTEQRNFEGDDNFIHDKLNLNLVKNSDGVYECRGRIAQDFPVYVPKGGKVAAKLIQHFHNKTLHGGVVLTMAAVRENFWIPKLRQQIKRVIKTCYGCKRYYAKAYADPPPGRLTSLRTQGERPFQVIGLDFAGPILYRKRNSTDHKSYILLFTCSLSRAIHLELLPNQTITEFIRAFKRVIARRGIPEVVFSDNAKTFIAANKWVKKLNFSEELHQYLSINKIRWQFNLSRAPWWGGQFERMVGLVKNMLYKTIRNSSLFWNELEEVLLDIETNLNNRPLTYIEEDITFPILTPNVLLIGQYSSFPTSNIDTEDADVIRRMKYVLQCKNAAWDRWRREYIKSLRERHNLKHKSQHSVVKMGDVVIIHSDNRNRGKWTLGVIIDMFPGKDDIIRAVKVKTPKGHLERAVQHLYPLELNCDIEKAERNQDTINLNPQAKEFRPRRNASAIAKCKISDLIQGENDPPAIE